MRSDNSERAFKHGGERIRYLFILLCIVPIRIYIYIRIYTHMFTFYTPIYLPLSLYACLSACLPACLPACRPAWSIYVCICLSTCFPIYIHWLRDSRLERICCFPVVFSNQLCRRRISPARIFELVCFTYIPPHRLPRSQALDPKPLNPKRDP